MCEYFWILASSFLLLSDVRRLLGKDGGDYSGKQARTGPAAWGHYPVCEVKQPQSSIVRLCGCLSICVFLFLYVFLYVCLCVSLSLCGCLCLCVVQGSHSLLSNAKGGDNHRVEVFLGDTVREFKAKLTQACEKDALAALSYAHKGIKWYMGYTRIYGISFRTRQVVQNVNRMPTYAKPVCAVMVMRE